MTTRFIYNRRSDDIPVQRYIGQFNTKHPIVREQIFNGKSRINTEEGLYLWEDEVYVCFPYMTGEIIPKGIIS